MSRRSRRAGRRLARPWFTLLVLVLAAATIVTITYRGPADRSVTSLRSGIAALFDPVQRVVAAALHPLGDAASGSVHFHDLSEQNARLRQEIAALKGADLRAADEESRLKELLALDHLPFARDMPGVMAEVIATGVSPYEVSVGIDKGTADGVATGMPVVTGAGLVGVVSQSSPHSALVLLITDTRSAIGVRFTVGGQPVFALAQGQGDGQPLRVSYVPPGTRLRKRSVVTTSGLENAALPPGIPVGAVSSVAQQASALQEQVTLEPVASLDELEYVTVLQWLPPPAPSQ